jgi:hypothetical protein
MNIPTSVIKNLRNEVHNCCLLECSENRVNIDDCELHPNEIHYWAASVLPLQGGGIRIWVSFDYTQISLTQNPYPVSINSEELEMQVWDYVWKEYLAHPSEELVRAALIMAKRMI